MANKNRLTNIEKKIKPPGAFLVVYEDPDNPGVYFDKSPWAADKKQIDPKVIENFEQLPGAILFRVRYVENWRPTRPLNNDDI